MSGENLLTSRGRWEREPTYVMRLPLWGRRVQKYFNQKGDFVHE